jgi:hypothetical protein
VSGELDLNYTRQWANQLGVTQALEEALEESRR